MREKSRRKQHQPAPPAREPLTARVAEWIALAGIYGALLAPLLHTRATMFPFVYPKALVFQAVVDIAFPAWVALALRDRRYRPRASLLLWSMLAWLAAMALATCFGENPRRSLFSYPERMTGLLSYAHVVAWFVMASGMLKTIERWRRLLEVHLAAALVVSCVAILQAVYPGILGAAPAAQGDRLIGLLGNPIFLGAYAAFSVPFAMVLFHGAGRGRRALYLLAALAAVWAMALGGSRGPIVGIVVGALVAILALGASGQYRRPARVAMAVVLSLAAGYGVFLVFLVNRPSMQSFWAAHSNFRHLFDFALEPARLGLWRGAWDGFLRRPLLGWGPSGYELALDAVFRPALHVLGLQDNAHNAVLSVLCETGAIGAIAYLGLWASFFVIAARAMRESWLTPVQVAALMGAGAAYFVQSLFAPEVMATDLAVAVTFAAVALARPASEPSVAEGRRAPRLGRRLVVGLVVAATLPVLLFGSIFPFAASYLAKRAVDRFPDNDSAGTISLLERTHRLPSPYDDDRLAAALGITRGLAQADLLVTWPQRKALIDLAVASAEDYLRDNPTHARLRSYVADTFVAIGRFTGDANLNRRAESLYLQSIAESPDRQTSRFAYARFLTESGRIPEAEEQYRKALAADPRIGEARWWLGQFLWQHLKQPDEGARLMADSIEGEAINRYSPASPLELVQLAQALSRQQRTDRLRGLVDRLRLLPDGAGPASACLEIAKMMEDLGLLAERDQVLRLALARNRALATTVDPVLSGTARLRPPGGPNAGAP